MPFVGPLQLMCMPVLFFLRVFWSLILVVGVAGDRIAKAGEGCGVIWAREFAWLELGSIEKRQLLGQTSLPCLEASQDHALFLSGI